MQPTGKSLILDLLSTLRGGAMPVRALVAAGEIFGIADNSVRVALARLLASGQVERDERGRYRMGASARSVQDRVAGWRRVEERVRPWRGGWIGVHAGALPRADRRGLRRRGRALRFLGFHELTAGLEVRPDNLSGGVAEVRRQLRALGLEPGAPVFALSDLDAESDARARRLWDAEALRRGYREARGALEESTRRLPTLPTRAAMRESFLLGGRVLRQIVLDPLLPDPILPEAERRALVEAMRRYDELGRGFWRAFLSDYGALPDRHTPVNVGDIAGALPARPLGEAA